MGACCALESAPKQAAKSSSSTSRPTTPKSARKKGEAPQAGSDATLHDAAWEGNVDLVRKLLLRDSPDLPDEEGSTPLHLQPARKCKQAATSHAIAVPGSCFDIRAADEGYMEVVKCLLEEGKAEATRLALILRTAQAFAVQMGFCIAQGAEGNTPLFLAAKEGRTDVVEYLLATAKFSSESLRAMADSESPHDAEIPDDLQRRLDLVKLQIAELFNLNRKLRTNFEHLSVAMLYAQKNRLLDHEELLRLDARPFMNCLFTSKEAQEELNRSANSAKHEGLGVDDDAGEPNSEEKKDRLVEEKDMEAAGDCIGDLERSYAKLLGRNLARNEPRYRYKPRPSNIANYCAIVCLDALDPPMEFAGDSFRQKQVAKHSAALQALNYLELQGADNVRIAAPKVSSDSEPQQIRRRRHWMDVELSEQGAPSFTEAAAEPSSLEAPDAIRNMSNAKGRLLEFLSKEVRRPLEEEEFQWSSLYSLSQCGFTATVQFNVEGWAVGSFTGAAFGRKKEAEQDAARLALLHLQKTKARRPQALPATLRLPADITIATLLERYLPETLEKQIYEVTWEGFVLQQALRLGSISPNGPSPLRLVLQKREDW
ncbi:hypothetical protein AK812_SmicGene28794 [Symbiodinium microadriaticum]|uniref:Uncharacterized protein n=1 Tax=Symbiodinium microadriaticum TaxID=2951 RepID=A0A1Q9D3K2_SYMMI|nr:hypothetical protein AK812_SmicGene28794 [Symbiodinium microadriaticum]